MKNLPPAIVRAALSMDQDAPWLVLLDIVMPGGERMSVVNNTDDITFQGQVYNAFSFEYEQPRETSKGEIPTVKISVSNVNRIIQGYVEQYDGGIGAAVTMYVVNAAELGEDYAELTTTFTVLGTKCNAQWVVFTLGSANPLNKQFPNWQYIANHCRFRYKGYHCGYAGALLTCAHTLDDCRAHGNSARFGGHPGLSNKGIRLV